MPQLDAASYFPQVFWVLIRFYLLYVRVAHAILPMMGRILWTRELKKTGASSQMGAAGNLIAEHTAKQEALLTNLPYIGQVIRLETAHKRAKAQALKTIWL